MTARSPGGESPSNASVPVPEDRASDTILREIEGQFTPPPPAATGPAPAEARFQPPASRARPGALRRVGVALLAPWRGLRRLAQQQSVRRWALVLAFTWLVTWSLGPLFPPLRLIAPALTTAVLLPSVLRWMKRAWRAFLRLRAAPWIEGTLVSVGFVAFGMGLFPKVFFADTVIDLGDHHVMRARAQLMAEALSRGEWLRYTHVVQGGDTLVDLYPNLASYGSALLHLLMPKGTLFAKTYSIFCVLLWSLRGIAVYNLCRRFSGPLLALLIAILAGYDLGGDHQDGTWVAFFRWGMIHNNLAITFALFATAAQIDLYRRVSAGAILVLVLSTAAAMFSHLLGMLYVSVLCGALLCAMLAGAGRMRRALRVLGVTLLGVGAASLWTLPYTYGMQHYGFQGAAGGINYAELADGLIEGKVPLTTYPSFYGLVIVALVVSIASRKVPRIFVAMVAVLFVVLSMTNWLIQAHVLTFIPSYADGWHRRALTCAKVAALPAVAALFTDLARRVRFKPRLTVSAVAAHAVLFIIFVSAFGRSAVAASGKLSKALMDQVPTAAMKVDGLRTHDTTSDNVAAMRWIADVRKADPSPTPWRVMLWGRDHPRGHMHWFWAQGVDMGLPVIDYGWTSANFLNNRPRDLSAECFRSWNIRYVITPQGGQPFPELKLVHKEGSYSVWELDGYDDRFVVAPHHVRITNLKLEGDEISFDVQGAEGGTDVQVRTAYYPRWSAEQNGQHIEVRPGPAHAGRVNEDQLITFVRDGRVRLTFGAPPPRFWPGLALSSLAALGTIFILGRRRRGWLSDRLDGLTRRVRHLALRFRSFRWYRRIVLAAGALLVLTLVTIGVFAGSRRLVPSPIEGWGMDVQMRRYGSIKNCQTQIHRGRYECMIGERRLVEVNAALGSTPVNDASGEWAKLWPSTRVHLMDESTTAIVTFSRVARSGALRLRTQSSGNVEVVVVSGAFRSQPLRLDGAQTHHIDLPRGLLPGKLTIELKPLGSNVWAHFWGGI